MPARGSMISFQKTFNLSIASLSEQSPRPRTQTNKEGRLLPKKVDMQTLPIAQVFKRVNLLDKQ